MLQGMGSQPKQPVRLVVVLRCNYQCLFVYPSDPFVLFLPANAIWSTNVVLEIKVRLTCRSSGSGLALAECLSVFILFYIIYIYPIFRAKMGIYVTRSKDRGGVCMGYPSVFRY